MTGVHECVSTSQNERLGSAINDAVRTAKAKLTKKNKDVVFVDRVTKFLKAKAREWVANNYPTPTQYGYPDAMRFLVNEGGDWLVKQWNENQVQGGN